jgi:hypothetical protein
MSTLACERSRLDAAYVLGALPPGERLEFEKHLAGCAACRRAVQELAGMPGLLAQVSPDVVLAAPAAEPVPDTLLARLDQEVRRVRRRRAWVRVGAAAAAVALVVGLGSVAVLQVRDGDRAPSGAPTTGPNSAGPSATPGPSPTRTPDGPRERAMVPVGQGVLQATVALSSVDWGTRLDLTCRYARVADDYGSANGATYALVVRTRDGGVEQVATWRALPGRTMSLSGATAADRADIASVEVRAPDGTPVLRLST